MPKNTRTIARYLNATVRKHKRVHERRRKLQAAAPRPELLAQTGISEVGTEAT